MNCQEFSSEFDTLLNSYAHDVLFGDLSSYSDINLDEYEKSVFLTNALEAIVKELYSGDFTGKSFESSELLRRALLILVELEEYTSSEADSKWLHEDKYIHTVFKLPPNLMYIVYEQVRWSANPKECLDYVVADVSPVTHDEYWRVRNNPFKGPNKRRVLRLDKGNTEVELVSNNLIQEYIIRYVRYPKPIILVDLTDSEVSINRDNKVSECELPELLHRMILDRAVRMALASKNINSRNNNGE